MHEHARNTAVAVLARRTPPPGITGVLWHVASERSRDYAHELYATLHQLDRSGCELLLVEAPPAGTDWDAVRDRLQRAATGSGQADPEDVP